MNLIGYARVSTDDQSLALRLNALAEFERELIRRSGRRRV